MKCLPDLAGDAAEEADDDVAASDQDLDELDSNPRSLFNLDTPSLKPASPPAPRDATAGTPPYPILPMWRTAASN